MKVSSLRKYRPHLESVLGPLSAEDDASVRTILDEVDVVLLQLARHFGRERAGWEGTGLELTWCQSGQVTICSSVGASIDEGKCVDFCFELRPSWIYGERSSKLSWEIETQIYADCQHAVYHRSMDMVYEAVTRSATAMEAVAELLRATRELFRQATELPLEHWLRLASDAVAN
jgi:hypothetical protein